MNGNFPVAVQHNVAHVTCVTQNAMSRDKNKIEREINKNEREKDKIESERAPCSF